MTTPTTLPEALTEIEELRGQVRELLRLLGQEAPQDTGVAGLSTSELAALNGMPEISVAQVSLERKQTRRERTQIVAEPRNVIETAPDIIFKLDLHGNLVGWNKRLETITGFVPEELNGRPALSFVPECEREQTAAAIRQAFEQGYAELEGHLLTKDQRAIPYHWTGAALRNDGGQVIGITGVGRDVSEKKRIEVELRRQQQHLLAAQAMAHVGSWDWNIVSGAMEWSEEQFRIFGYEPKAIPATCETFLAALLPDDHDRVVAWINDTLEGKTPLDVECRVVRPDGEIRTVHYLGKIIRAEDGSSVRLSGSTLDITDRKQAESALQESESHFRAMIENSSDIITVLDLDGTIRFESPSFERLLGYAQHEIDGRIAFDFIHPDDLPAVLEKFQMIVQRPGETHTAEFRFRHQDGSWLSLEGVGRATCDARSRSCVIVNSRDITERKRAERSLLQTRDLLTSFVENVPAAVAMLDKELRYVAVSRRWLIDYRLGDERLVGRRHYDVFPEIQAMKEWQEIHQRCLSGSVERREEDRFVRADGSEDWLRWEVRPWHDVTGEIGGIIMFTEVISERKQAEMLLRSSQEKLRQALQASNTGLWDWNTETNEVSFSQEWKHQLGYDEGELPDAFETWESRLYPEDRDRAIAYVRGYLTHPEDEYRLEFRLRHKDGSYRWIEARASIVTEPDGRRVRLLGSHTDITVRKQMEAELAEREERLRLFIEHSPVALAMLDQEMRYVAVSRRWRSDYRVGDGPLIGRNHYEVFPEIPERWRAIYRRCLAGAIEGCEEDPFIRTDGRTDWSRWEVRPWRKPDGSVGGIIIFLENITLQIHAQEVQRRLAAIVEASDDAIISKDLNGLVTSWNRGAERLFGYQAEEIIGRPITTLFPPDRLHEEVLILERMKRGESIERLESVRLAKDGRRLDISLTLSPMRDEHGTIVGVSKIAHDITERKCMEDALRMTQFSIDRASDAVLWMDSGSHILSVNEAACRLLNYTREELIAMSICDLDPNVSAESWALHWEQLKQKGSMTFESRYWSSTGHVVETEITANYLRYGGKEYDCAIVRNVTERKQAEATLRLAKFSMERAADAVYWIDPQAMILDVNEAASAMLGYSKDEFCAMTVHDLHPDFQADRWPGFWADTKQRGTMVLETAHRAKDGRLIPIEVSINYLAYEGQEYHCAFVRDITERKRAEHEVNERTQLILKMQAALLRLTHLDDTGLTPADLLPRVCEVVAETLGVARVSVWLLSENETELVCQNLYDRSHAVHSAGSRLSTSQYPRYLEEIAASLVVAAPDALADPRTSEFVDHYFLPLGITSMMDAPIRRQGTLVGVLWLEHVGLPRDWSHEAQSFGASVGEILGRMMETVERERVEMELQNSHAFMRQVIDTNPNFIFAKDRDGRFTLVNKATADVYGATVEDLLGKTDADFNSRHEEVTQFRLKDLEVMDTLQERFIPEEKITDVTGKIRWLQTVKRPLLDVQGHAVMLLGASTDITARKRVEEMLRQRERDLRAAVEERERISEDLHDGILQSIFAVGLGLESCRTLVFELPLPRKKITAPLMEGLNHAIGQLNHVMTDVRNFIAGIESHVLEEGDIGETLRTMVQAMCASNRTACRVTIEEAAVRELSTGQAYHVMNVIREALCNSIRHSGAGRITLSLKRLRRSVRLRVTDNGKGFIPDLVRDAGHGLINMAARARKLGGQIEVRSRPRQGTKVLLDIPRRPVDE